MTDNLVKKHKEDAVSVQLAVKELQHEPFNPVLIYKPQGVKSSEHPALTEDAFVLVLQTEFQMQLYQAYAESVLCIDSTHGTNAYNFKLLTCIVADNFGQGTINYIMLVTSVTNSGTFHKLLLSKNLSMSVIKFSCIPNYYFTRSTSRMVHIRQRDSTSD